jgi:tRNA-splicing ligase RtcB
MNARQLEKIGIPGFAANLAIQAIQKLVKQPEMERKSIEQRLRQVAESPALFLGDPVFNTLARELLENPAQPEPASPVAYRTWGSQIDEQTFQQMNQACRLPIAVGAALMPDAHVGYGLPIGGVLATENAIIPYAVGVDIACRMKLSVLDLPVESLDRTFERYRVALENGTCFGVGGRHEKPQYHEVLDRDWTICRVTREHRDRARAQLGTSGSGNHFVEFGVLTVNETDTNFNLPPGTWVALLSHSGSRGVGASVCSHYSGLAQRSLPKRYQHFDRLGWLDMSTEAGQEYFAAMNLMGDYAAANHDVIHRLVSHLVGGRIIAGVENHHNFAWLEKHGGRDVCVHRKGATPAGKGVLGVIPGSMGSPAFVVRGLGNPESLESASHGAGRLMSRTQAQNTFKFGSIQKALAARGIRVLSAGADEVPGVYKDIEKVMAEQADLVTPIARFDPRIVKMCGDGSKAED